MLQGDRIRDDRAPVDGNLACGLIAVLKYPSGSKTTEWKQQTIMLLDIAGTFWILFRGRGDGGVLKDTC